MAQITNLKCEFHDGSVEGICTAQQCPASDRILCLLCLKKFHTDCKTYLSKQELIEELKQAEQDLADLLSLTMSKDQFLVMKTELIKQLDAYEDHINKVQLEQKNLQNIRKILQANSPKSFGMKAISSVNTETITSAELDTLHQQEYEEKMGYVFIRKASSLSEIRKCFQQGPDKEFSFLWVPSQTLKHFRIHSIIPDIQNVNIILNWYPIQLIPQHIISQQLKEFVTQAVSDYEAIRILPFLVNCALYTLFYYQCYHASPEYHNSREVRLQKFIIDTLLEDFFSQQIEYDEFY